MSKKHTLDFLKELSRGISMGAHGGILKETYEEMPESTSVGIPEATSGGITKTNSFKNSRRNFCKNF